MRALILVEHHQQSLHPSTAACVQAARQCADEITLFVIGNAVEEIANSAAKLEGVTEVITLQDPTLENLLAESVTAIILEQLDGVDYLIAPADTFGKNILPRVAAKRDVAMLTDVINIISANTFERPIYAGNAIATVECNEPIKILTVRPSAFEPVGLSESSAPITPINITPDHSRSEFVSAELTKSDRPELTSADVVVSGGRALGSAENFHLIEALADQLGAAVGASRAAVDAGFVPNDYQVGQTGKIVAPNLYIAVGLSGAIQHLAGMKESKVIVAINNDPDAPIFQVADYGFVADLFEAVPELTQKLQEA